MKKSILTKKQVKTFRRDYYENGKPQVIIAEVRYDDECGNGHNSFAVTGTIYDTGKRPGEEKISHKDGAILYCSCGGCIHAEIAKHFPQLAPLLKWHLCSSEGPMHYIANTVFFAGNADAFGHQSGEPEIERRLIIAGILEGVKIHLPEKEYENYLAHKDEGIRIHCIYHETKPDIFKPKYTFYPCRWYECGFDSEEEAFGCLELFRSNKVSYQDVIIGHYEGKERELDKARNAAIWPEATDEEFSCSSEDLAEKLYARLPGLLEDFQKAVESLGFTY